MIMTVAELKQRIDCGAAADDLITSRLKAIESVIRAYTNNNFQLRDARFSGHSDTMRVYGHSPFIQTGDTVQISGSGVNDGLYTVADVSDRYIQLDAFISAVESNLVTKIRYPLDVVECAVDLYKWKQNMGDKVGIKSETISRHSVTYEDSGTLYMGYPTGILNGLNLYKKARC